MSAREHPAATFCPECGTPGGRIHAFSCSRYPEVASAANPSAEAYFEPLAEPRDRRWHRGHDESLFGPWCCECGVRKCWWLLFRCPWGGKGTMLPDRQETRSAAQRRQFVVYEETGEEREVIGYCRACRATPDEDARLVSPQGVAHHAEADTTDCGHDATGPDWWWRA